MPFRDDHGVAAWLLCGFYPARQLAPQLSERDWLQLSAALAGPLLGRLREQQHHHQLERLEALQGLLGTGWWELFPQNNEIQLAPQLALNLLLEPQTRRLSLQAWLALIHRRSPGAEQPPAGVATG